MDDKLLKFIRDYEQMRLWALNFNNVTEEVKHRLVQDGDSDFVERLFKFIDKQEKKARKQHG